MPYGTTPYNRPQFKVRVVVPPAESYSGHHTYHEKINAHARSMLTKTVELVAPHINSPHSNFTILNEESAYLKAEIEKANAFTPSCSDSHAFYKSLDIPNPNEFHQKLCASIYSSMRTAWADYTAKQSGMSGEGFSAFVKKRMDQYTPVMQVNVGKLKAPTANVGPAQLLPPVRPPGMRIQGRGKYIPSANEVDDIPPVPKFKMIETRMEDEPLMKTSMPGLIPLGSSMPGLKPLQTSIETQFIEGKHKCQKHKQDKHDKYCKKCEKEEKKKDVKDQFESTPIDHELPKLEPIIENPLESSMPQLKPFIEGKKDKKKKKKHLKDQFESTPIEHEMPELEPLSLIENDLPEFEQDDLIEGPVDWARRKKDQFTSHRKEKAQAKATKSTAKAKTDAAKADELEEKEAANKKRREQRESRKEDEKAAKETRKSTKPQFKSVAWLANHLEGVAGFEKLSLPIGKSYIYMASSDEVIEQLLDRQQQRGGTLNTLLFVKSHLAEKPSQSMITASFTTMNGTTVQKNGDMIVRPELLNPKIISAGKMTIGSNEFTILEHDNVFPGKPK